MPWIIVIHVKGGLLYRHREGGREGGRDGQTDRLRGAGEAPSSGRLLGQGVVKFPAVKEEFE